ncbi:TetR/AcrR family transcriptional regulator [Paenibacillus ehimensis]|uniref:TetR/AcrR family transcriptional regulator n=1 Tax=Paenibacillus ehimensis TaxID=79264 RepID=UPI0004720BC4|nr:TetR/AcrR family transcriptional regulator [Paenibacillus ehimensis]MEC0208348.1 TetR/AcrR family transcriptional regulator [Paenibacillus ehimensis]
MPYTKKHKMNIRHKILQSASQAFRASGIKAVSVPQIMSGAGLTHGGFYAHFDSKEQLVAEACKSAMEDTVARLGSVAEQTADGQKLTAVIESYLSATHRDSAEQGCIMPALAGEIARSSEDIREVFTDEVSRFLSFVSGLVGQDEDKSIALTATMVGSILLARSINDPELSDKILSVCRADLKQRTAGPVS